MSNYWRTLYRHVTKRNVRFSDFSPSSALDVVETKRAINHIVLALKVINTDFSSKLFITIVCCLQHVEILPNCASARHRAKCTIFGFFAKFGGRHRRYEKGYRPDCFSAKNYQDCFFERIIYHNCLLFTTCRIIDELCIGTSLSEMSDFRTFRLFACRRRRKKSYQPNCFSAKNYWNCFFERIICHNCLLLITRRNIDELCIGTSLSEMFDFQIFR